MSEPTPSAAPPTTVVAPTPSVGDGRVSTRVPGTTVKQWGGRGQTLVSESAPSVTPPITVVAPTPSVGDVQMEEEAPGDPLPIAVAGMGHAPAGVGVRAGVDDVPAGPVPESRIADDAGGARAGEPPVVGGDYAPAGLGSGTADTL